MCVRDRVRDGVILGNVSYGEMPRGEQRAQRESVVLVAERFVFVGVRASFRKRLVWLSRGSLYGALLYGEKTNGCERLASLKSQDLYDLRFPRKNRFGSTVRASETRRFSQL